MTQPADDAVRKLGLLAGDWRLVAVGADGHPWPGEAHARIEWHQSGAHLVQRTMAGNPDAPDTVSIMGCDAANGTYYQLYSDIRGVCRVYQMSLTDQEWRLWRTGAPFAQRFTGRFQDGGDTIAGRWEIAEDGADFRLDFTLVYTRNPARP